MKGYIEWAARYSGIFGLTSAADQAMVQAWQAVFDAAEYRADELEEATDWLSQNAASMNRPDHRPAIQQRVRERRLEMYRLEDERLEDRGFACSDCGGSGQVCVPHLKQVRDGEWLGHSFCSVTCRCARGERIASSYRQLASEKSPGKQERPVLARLVDYEVRNPKWVQQLRQRQKQLLASGYADQLAKVAQSNRPLSPVQARGQAEGIIEGIGMIPKTWQREMAAARKASEEFVRKHGKA